MKRISVFHHKPLSGQAGFTIIELMIATLVFSTILLAITAGVLSFTHAYYKGINASSTQDVARNIIDTVSQAIQFGGNGSVTKLAGKNTYCIGNTRQFDFVLYKQESANPTGDQVLHALTSSPIDGGCQAKDISGAFPDDSESIELLSPSMRLSKFTITNAAGSSNLWQVSVTVAYGDDDLLNGPDTSDPSCKSTVGSEYCYVAALTTIVQKRVGAGL